MKGENDDEKEEEEKGGKENAKRERIRTFKRAKIREIRTISEENENQETKEEEKDRGEGRKEGNLGERERRRGGIGGGKAYKNFSFFLSLPPPTSG